MPDPKQPASAPGFNDAMAPFQPAAAPHAPAEAEKTAFREALLRHMAAAGVGAAALARATGVSKPQIDKLCQRKSETTNVADAIRLAAYFGKSVEAFCDPAHDKIRSPAMTFKTEDAGDHPLWGCMAGTITLSDGTDLTDPMFTDDEMEGFLDRKTDLLRGLPG